MTHMLRNMNHTALIETVAHESGLTQKVVEQVLRATFDVVGRTVASGFKVSITNFGTWYSAVAPSRIRRNPQTGDEWRAPKTRYPRFRYSPAVTEATTTGKVPETLKKRASHH